MKKYILTTLIALVAGFTNLALGQLKPPPPINPTLDMLWEQMTDIDTALHSAASFAIGDKIYVVTGDTTSWFFRGRLIPTTYEYDTSTKVWTRKAPFPGKLRIGAVGFSIGNKGYIGGGRNFAKADSVGESIYRPDNKDSLISLNPRTYQRVDTTYTYTNANGDSLLSDFWEYDPNTDTWTQKADIPGTKTGRAYGVGFSIDGKGYVGLGYDNAKIELDPTNVTVSDLLLGPYVDSIKVVQINPGPPPISQVETVFRQVIKRTVDSVYTDSLDYLTDFWEYNPNNNTWTKKADFPGQGRAFASSFPIFDKFVDQNIGIVGLGLGDSIPGALYDDFYFYNPATNSWKRTADFPASKRFGAASFSLGFLGYIVGGNDGLVRKDFYEYDHNSKTWERYPNLPDSARALGSSGITSTHGYVGAGAGPLESYETFYKWPVDTNRVEIVHISKDSTFAVNTLDSFCAGDQFFIKIKNRKDYKVDTTVFTAELSDTGASFIFPIKFDSTIIQSRNASHIILRVTSRSDSVLSSGNYKLRVNSVEPRFTGEAFRDSFFLRRQLEISVQPLPQTNCLGTQAMFMIALPLDTALGDTAQYEWYKDGVKLTDPVKYVKTDSNVLLINNVQISDSGSYHVILRSGCSPELSSDTVKLTVLNIPPPTIVNQPLSDSACEAASKTFSLTATGTSLNYRWLKGNDTIRNSPFITGSNTPSLTINPTRLTDSGWYRCIIFENCGSRILSDSVKLNFFLNTQILEQPVNIDTVEFVDIGFKVETQGKNLTYKWYKGNTQLFNGTKYEGADTDSLTIKNLQMGDVGFYRCEVSGDCGTPVNSLLGLLEIDPMPVITEQPRDSSSDCETSTAFFSVKVDGANISYEWYKDAVKLVNGGNISGADERTVVISNISTADEGFYHCVVSTGPYTKVTSDSGKLIVKPIPAKPVIGKFGPNGLQSDVSGDVYRWYIDNVYEPTLTGQTILNLTRVGDYRVRVTKDGCISELSDPYFWFPTVGLTEVNAGSINLYPNPASTLVDVEIPQGLTRGDIKIYDIVGKQISTSAFENTTSFTINVSGLNQGIYYVTITATDGSTYVGKLVKE